MAYLDAADCAKRVKYRLNRPSTDTAFTDSATDDILYAFMTEAQDEVNKLIATYIPDAVLTVPTALTTADSGKTYTFGTGVDSEAIFALGNFSVFATRADIPDNPLEPGVDFTVEGTKLRIPNNVTRTFSDSGPWAQFVSTTNVITASTQPTIPIICRLAMIEKTAGKCADRLGLDSSGFDQAFNERWLEVLAAVRTQASGKYGATISRRTLSSWTRRYR